MLKTPPSRMSAAPRLRLWQRLTAVLNIFILLVPPQTQAGDILRGGAAANAPRANPSANSGAAAAAQARTNAQDALSRTSQALNAVKNMQAAARAAAAQSGAANLGADPNHPGATLPNVPNGLAPGGLQFVSAVGANAPTQSGNDVNIKQNVQQALINWTTFNVGRETSVNFDQSAGGSNAGQWIAFNKVNDPSGSPSQILGKINAQGQVYIINQNGIIFGGTSQVNVHTLVASSLPINDNLIDRGLLNNPDAQFLFSALALPAGSKGPTNAFTPPAPPNTATGQLGDVVVQPGAQLTAPTSDAHVGGRIALIGPNVTNAGTISTPDGQTILAAGLQVGFDAHKSSDASLRGLDVYVGEVGTYGGTATNSGLIDAPRANVTITGKNVNQLGAINSSTSVSLNGRIDLKASYGAQSNSSYDPVVNPDIPPFLYTNTGQVTMGSSSVSQILPEWSSTDKVVGTKLALPSQINVEGNVLHMESNALLLAPNAKVAFNAGVWNYSAGASPRSDFVHSGGQIYLDRGAMVNVAGSTDVQVPLSQSILTVQLRGAELANSPLQRGGILRGPSIVVDIRKSGVYNGTYWVGTPLADLSGYLGLIQRTVGELTIDGGSVTFSSGSSLVMQGGSSVNVSGGYINYGGGTVRTTRVWYGGHIIDIADATPDRLYGGIYTGTFTSSHPRWAVTNTYMNALPLTGEHYEQPYLNGGGAGSLAITSPAMALDGDLSGASVVGPRQRSAAPQLGELSLTFTAQQILPNDFSFPTFSPTPPSVVFDKAAQAAADPFSVDATGHAPALREDRRDLVNLSPELLTTSGFGKLTVDNPDGNVTVPHNTHLAAPPLGSIKLFGANVNVEGSISAPGGTIGLTAYNISPSVAVSIKLNNEPRPGANPSRGLVSLGSGSVLDAAGLIVDDRLSAISPLAKPLVTTGGSVSISAFSADLQNNSVIDVSGGVAVSALGKRTYGDAGSISIATGVDQNLGEVLGGHLKLGSILKGFSGAKGGSLSLQAMLVQIGGRGALPDALHLSPDFFSEGGFASFSLTGIGTPTDVPGEYNPGVLIAPNTVIKPVVKSYLAVLYGMGSDDAVMVPVTKPEGLRTPASLSFEALGALDGFKNTIIARGDVVMGAGARIETDGLGSVKLSGQTVTVLGSIISPGGTIVISGANKFPEVTPSEFALSTVYIGPRSLISAAGKVILMRDGYGRRTGSVLPGGSITVSGNIVAEAGSTLDVSGTSGVFDLGPQYVGDAQNPKIPLNSGITAPLYNIMGIPTRIDSNGGLITLKGGQELFVDSKLLGRAGGPTALGGALSISSGKYYTPAVGNITTADINLTVTQSGPTLPQPFWPGGGTSIGKPVLDAGGNPVTAMGYFASDSFTRGGFDSLALNGNVRFSGPVDIKARAVLKVGTGGIIEANDAVHLKAAYAILGQPFLPPVNPSESVVPFTEDAPGIGVQTYYPQPTYGPGSITVVADLIDIGNLSLQNIGKAAFVADRGDIRGSGTLDVAGDIYLRAAQIYPTTASQFNIVAYDYVKNALPKQGSITIEGSGVRSLPFSAGGELNVFASNIWQGGTLRAPIGTINIGWDGTGTAPVDPLSNRSMPVAQNVTLAEGSVISVSAIDPITGQGVLLPYGLILNGTSWIDPRGVDITAGGGPTKHISIAGVNLTTQAGSSVDLRGGGDLYAYRWVSGTGGNVDILGTSSLTWDATATYAAGTLVSYKGQTYSARQGSTGVTPTPNLYWTQVQKTYAVLPGYGANYAPYDPFNASQYATNLGGDPGYVNNAGLSVGDRVYLGGSAALRAGSYTLLPARYALLPGAVLVTPLSGSPIGTFGLEDGSHLVSGFAYNNLNSSRDVPTIFSRFEVASSSVLRQRAEYKDYFANTFLKERAAKLGLTVDRLPEDAGHLILSASQSMNLLGQVQAQSTVGGRGGLVDISSSADIYIGSGGSGPPGAINLNASKLSSFGAESLLIGGFRTEGTGSTTVAVRTANLTLDNATTPLTGPEIILVSNKNLTLGLGSQIIQSGSVSGNAATLLLGNASTPGSGDGTLVRVTSDPAAQTIRSGVTASTLPHMVVGAGTSLSGGGITLDSTYGTSLDSTATLDGQAIYLNSGQISLQLNNPGTLFAPTEGLVLAGPALQSLQKAQSLSFLSYSSIDTYGTGQIGTSTLVKLALHAAEIRGFNTAGGAVGIAAQDVVLDNSPNRPSPGAAVVLLNGSLSIDAGVIHLGVNQTDIDQFASVTMKASGGVINEGTGGLKVAGDLTFITPMFTASNAASRTISADGNLILLPSGGAGSVTAGLGAKLNLEGASVVANSIIQLPSGLLTIHAKSGNLTVNGTLDAGGSSKTFYDVVRYADAGEIRLSADAGNVILSSGSTVNVAALPGGGDAGTLSVLAPVGTFSANGSIFGSGGSGGQNGSFLLDAGSQPSLAGLASILNAASFNRSQSIRVRTGDVSISGLVQAHNYTLSLDSGSITVASGATVDASGATGGKINLMATGSITLSSGSTLTVAGSDFDAAGKGGAISIEAGSSSNGTVALTTLGSGPQLAIQSNAIIDLSVASVNSAADPIAATALAAFYGQFTGTLHLRAPQTSNNRDLQIAAIDGNIKNASSIVVEGYRTYTPASGLIGNVTAQVQANGNTFVGTSGADAVGYAAMRDRLFLNNTALKPIAVIVPGAEIVNTSGDLTLGTPTSTTTADLNLASFRFGTRKAPGVLTLRAAGNIVLYNAISDGFTPTLANTNLSWLWLAPMTALNTALPTNVQSWSYRITSGADFTSADFHGVRTLDSLAAGSGSLQIGKNAGVASAVSPGAGATTASIMAATGKAFFQVIRTGTGDIDITTGRSLQLLNPFVSIYTAGVQVPNPSFVFASGDWVNPVIVKTPNPSQGPLGVVQQSYFAQYSMAGGNVNVHSQEDMLRQTKDINGNLILDSQRELPNNWLYRRGYVDATGKFGLAGVTSNVNVDDTSASTTWWVDFSNFFEGIGALGGGNINLTADRDIVNVDALIPTNARMPSGTPDSSKLVELGGGDLSVRAGRDLSGGVYYVERGAGNLDAGRNITTNSSRSPSLGRLASLSDPEVFPEATWLPTTLFLGKGSFDVSARGSVLMGPVANPFLLPQGINNRYWYKTYFSTYAPDSSVAVSSLGGDVTFRESATLPTDITATPLLQLWMSQEQLLNSSSAANYQPWLRTIESSVAPFATVAALLPPKIDGTAFAGNINLVGNLTLAPSPTGNLGLFASGGINGLQATGLSDTLISGETVTAWSSSRINVSDANPASVPGITAPLALVGVVGRGTTVQNNTPASLLKSIDLLFAETGSTTGSAAVIQTKQALHTAGLLHVNDLEPVRLYAAGGDLSGVTLFTPKASRIVASGDISDVSFYLQNLATDDVSVVAAGRDIVAYNANTASQVLSRSTGNALNFGQGPQAGDLQINGPGTLEVLAGRNLDLGSGSNNADGTGIGLVSIGNGRNPYLPFAGADIIAGAGIGPSSSLSNSSLNFTDFISKFVTGGNGSRYLSELSAFLGTGGNNSALASLTSSSFTSLPKEEQDRLALAIFYLVLRDAGRDHTLAGGDYSEGFNAISSLFPMTGTGDITTQGRDVRTRSGGNISLFAPGGGLTLQTANISGVLAPPGIITESGGSISIVTNTNVDLGISRIFTLRGGDITIWSSTGNIAAGSSSKTVQSAPPTRVLIDPQSGDVKTDLAGLATGGGIGVLATVAGVAPGNVDLIAPVGTIDAGDAGIRATGNLNIAATAVLNASNIAVSGASSGTPSVAAPSAPNIAGITSASSTAGASNSTAGDTAKQAAANNMAPKDELPSIITVEVLGYGGGEDDPSAPGNSRPDDEERRKRLKKEMESAQQKPVSQPQ